MARVRQTGRIQPRKTKETSVNSNDSENDTINNNWEGPTYQRPDGTIIQVKDWKRVYRCAHCNKGGYNRNLLFLWIQGKWYHESCCV